MRLNLLTGLRRTHGAYNTHLSCLQLSATVAFTQWCAVLIPFTKKVEGSSSKRMIAAREQKAGRIFRVIPNPTGIRCARFADLQLDK